MCVRSQQVTLWDLLDAQTPSSEGSLASLGLSQANNAEQTIPATCGPSTTALFATCGHGGYLEKTCPVCCLQVPTQSSPIWKRRATPAGRSYWVLTTSARRTDASECSSSRDWPTPTTWEQQESLETWQARREAVKVKAKNGNGFGVPLDMAVQMWPTPCAREWKDGTSSGNRKSPNLGPTVFGQPDQANPNIRGRSRARLNPRWVAQLMGFPADWLDGVQVPSRG